MKKAVFTIMFCFLFLGLNAQDEKKFDIQKTQIGNYLVKSTGEQSKIEGNIGRVVIVDQKAVDELVKNAVKDVLNKDEFKSLHSASPKYVY
jgi:ABC-type enterochelin transport system substrate-binding protein